MNKKLMAVAVAGALAAPAVAFAQASTVQLYGKFLFDYGVHVQQPNTPAGASRHNADALNTGGSYLGFKGEENLGGGLSAWFQCETDVRFLGGGATTAGAWCDRNSALGLKGGFGNVFIGTWDSPIKAASGKTRMLNETGWLGAQRIILAGPFSFSNRLANTVNYATPKFGDFSASAQYTTVQTALDAPSTANAKGRLWGLGADYASGPLLVAAAWARHNDNRSAGGVLGTSDTAWLIGATYTMAPFKAGLTFTRSKNEPLTTTEVKRNAWNLALDYKITGPGSILFGYSHAGNASGSAASPTTGGGAKQWQIGYNHALSKRTVGGLAYVRLDNNSTGTYNLTGLTIGAGGVQPGDNASAFVLSLTHSF